MPGPPKFCANCGYPANDWSTFRCPECGKVRKTTPNPRRALMVVLAWLVVMALAVALPVWLWVSPFELSLLRSVECEYTTIHGPSGVRVRGLVVLREHKTRQLPIWEGSDPHLDYTDVDPDKITMMQASLIDDTRLIGLDPEQLRHELAQVNTLSYDPRADAVKFMDQGQEVNGPMDDANVRRWLSTTYPSLTPAEQDIYAQAIPLVLRSAAVGDWSYQLRDKLHQIDKGMHRPWKQNGGFERNDNPFTLRFSTTYAVVVGLMFLAATTVPGWFLIKSIGRARWHFQKTRTEQ